LLSLDHPELFAMSNEMEASRRIDRKTIQRQIERLDAPADVKATLSALVDKTIDVGGKIIDFGARVLAFIFDLAKSYPNLTIGLVAALVMSYLVSSIPLFGPMLSPLLTPLLLIVGVGIGALNDMTDARTRQRLSSLEKQFRDMGVA
jgi:hypothetical protein